MHPLTDERLPNDTLMFTSCPLRSTRRVSVCVLLVQRKQLPQGTRLCFLKRHVTFELFFPAPQDRRRLLIILEKGRNLSGPYL